MRNLIPSRTAKALSLALGAAGLAAIAAPAFAQTYYTVPEVVVTPERLGPDGRPMTLSRTVNISDLDLRYDRDVREMQRRVRTTARQICDDLGERDVIPSVSRNCVNDAVRRTDYQMQTAIAQARSTTYYAYAAPAPVAPYAGYYAPPAAAVVPVYPAPAPEYEEPLPPEL
jgi:UrcA family protein